MWWSNDTGKSHGTGLVHDVRLMWCVRQQMSALLWLRLAVLHWHRPSVMQREATNCMSFHPVLSCNSTLGCVGSTSCASNHVRV